MKTIDEILDEWYPTIPNEEHNGLYARDKVKLIAQEFADQFRQPAVISQFCECIKEDWDGADVNGNCVHCGKKHK